MRALDLRLYLGTAAMRIRVSGKLHTANAHLLSKVVIGCVRRYAIPALELDVIGGGVGLDLQRPAFRDKGFEETQTSSCMCLR